jgi:hypothetical protein
MTILAGGYYEEFTLLSVHTTECLYVTLRCFAVHTYNTRGNYYLLL